MAATGKIAPRAGGALPYPSTAGPLAPFLGAGGLDDAAEYGHSVGVAMVADRVWVSLRDLE